MSPYYAERYRREPAYSGASFILALVLIVALIFLLGYFLWYAPHQRTIPVPKVGVSVPKVQKPNVGVQYNPPGGGSSSKPSGGGSSGGR